MTTRESCTCDDCKSACSYKPGWFKPGEAERVAEFLGMSLQHLFDSQLMVDWWADTDGDGVNIFLLSPAMVGEDTGTEAPGWPRGRCVFFKNGLCSIHSVKPFECRDFWHEDTQSGDETIVQNRHREAAISWKDHQRQLRQLLGRRPVAVDGFDLLSSFLFRERP